MRLTYSPHVSQAPEHAGRRVARDRVVDRGTRSAPQVRCRWEQQLTDTVVRLLRSMHDARLVYTWRKETRSAGHGHGCAEDYLA